MRVDFHVAAPSREYRSTSVVYRNNVLKARTIREINLSKRRKENGKMASKHVFNISAAVWAILAWTGSPTHKALLKNR